MRRHGWGIEADPERAVQYLTAAASNAASIEQLALQAGMAKGGAAKGELVLAIFELANCFRHGWGIAIDPVAAKQVRWLCPRLDRAFTYTCVCSAVLRNGCQLGRYRYVWRDTA